MIISILKVIISLVMSLVCAVTSPFALWTKSDYTPKDPDNVKLTFATMSDVHLDDTLLRKSMLMLGLDDLEKSSYRPDALILMGDNTDHGFLEQYEILEDAMSKYDVAGRVHLMLGNHDTWTEDKGSILAHRYYKEYYERITGNRIDKVYSSMVINGYHFITLSSEEDWTYAVISDEQLAWFANEMEAASKDGKPIFVMCHWPINQTHGLPLTFQDHIDDPMSGGLGPQSDKVNEIMQKYDNVFYISGHIHSGVTNDETAKRYGYSSIEKHGNVTCVNCPSYQFFSERGVLINGTGYVFEVYDDEVKIRVRSYIGGFWLNNYEYDIAV